MVEISLTLGLNGAFLRRWDYAEAIALEQVLFLIQVPESNHCVLCAAHECAPCQSLGSTLGKFRILTGHHTCDRVDELVQGRIFVKLCIVLTVDFSLEPARVLPLERWLVCVLF